jgi:hypothetical protein
MALHINDDSMSLEINGAAVKAAVRLDNLWRVTGWPRLLTRNEAITALVLAERLLAGYGGAAVAAVAAVISYRHAYELVSTHGETGVTARLVPFTVDGLILAASMLMLDASRRNHPAPPLARWCLGAGIVATIGANLAHGLGHGPIGALVSAWPALALAGSFELSMTLIRTGHRMSVAASYSTSTSPLVPVTEHDAPPALTDALGLEQTVRAWRNAGHSQRHSPRTQC